MTQSIAVMGSKGGITKSTIVRALSVAYTVAEWDTLIADMEQGQATSRKFVSRREEAGILPALNVKSFGAVSLVERELKTGNNDLIIIDCPAFATKSAIDTALIADLVVLPTGFSIDDMESTANFANSLVLQGISPDKICIVFSGIDEKKTQTARDKDYEKSCDYFSPLPYEVINGYIPRLPSLREAQDVGRSIIECTFPGPRAKADHVIQGIIAKFESLTGDI